jgi:uncharacterized membrane protein YraQ (UPF0718 family)
MKKSDNQKKQFQGTKLMLIVMAIYILLYFINATKTIDSLKHFAKNTISIIPIFLFVIVLTAIINYYFPKEKTAKLLQGKSNFATYSISLIAGIVSHGPVFAWFPLLKDLKDKGVKKGGLVTFFYGRGIKLTLLPVMISYFGFLYTMIFIAYIAAFAILQGILFEKVY